MQWGVGIADLEDWILMSYASYFTLQQKTQQTLSSVYASQNSTSESLNDIFPNSTIACDILLIN